MANQDNPTRVMTSCPICGYTDQAGDPALLQDAINEHIRMSHNLDPATLSASSEIKDAASVENDFREGDYREGVTPGEAAGYGVNVLGHNYRINQ